MINDVLKNKIHIFSIKHIYFTQIYVSCILHTAKYSLNTYMCDISVKYKMHLWLTYIFILPGNRLMIHKDMIDYGLRVGSVITIDNVHIINEWFWRGLYSCIVSHLLVVSVSHHQSIHQVS